MWSTRFCGLVLNFRCKHSFLSVSATICSGKWQRQTAQFLKYGVMTTHSQSVHAAAALSLNFASQNLIGLAAHRGLVPPNWAMYNGSGKQ